MGLFYKDYLNNGVWEYTDDDNYKMANACIQEILLWRGEANFYNDSGIDYKAIFNSTTFLSSQLDEILEKYKPFFRDITNNITKIDTTKFLIKIEFYFNIEQATGNIQSYSVSLVGNTFERGINVEVRQ